MGRSKTAKVFFSIFLSLILLASALPVLAASEPEPIRVDAISTALEGEQFVLTISAYDADGVQYIAIKENGKTLANIPNLDFVGDRTTFNYDYYITKNSPGSFDYVVSAYDDDDHPMFPPVTKHIEVLNSLEIIGINTDDNNIESGEKFNIVVKAKDNFGLNYIALYREGVLIENKPCYSAKEYTAKFEQSIAKETTYFIQASDSKTLVGKFITVKLSTTPGNQLPTDLSITATPESGDAPLFVDFVGSATDPEGDSLTYSWDFDGGISTDTTGKTINNVEFENPGSYVVTLTVSDGQHSSDENPFVTKTITVNEHHEEDHDGDGDGYWPGGGHGGSGAGGGAPGGGAPSGGLPLGILVFETTRIELTAGETISVPVEIMNFGAKEGEFEIQIERCNFGGAEPSFDSVKVGARSDVRSYLHLEADDDAEGQYILKVNLLQNGVVVDSADLYVEVQSGASIWSMFGLISLLIISLAGVAGLGYLAYKEYTKKRERTAQVELERYY